MKGVNRKIYNGCLLKFESSLHAKYDDSIKMRNLRTGPNRFYNWFEDIRLMVVDHLIDDIHGEGI